MVGNDSYWHPFAAFSGKMPDITTAAFRFLQRSRHPLHHDDGRHVLWTGLMEIAEKSGILKTATVRLSPLIHFLFPELPKDHPAEKPIAANIIANVLGLGWAATPAGLEAMEELQKLEEDRRLGKAAGPVRKRGVASNEMCTFLIVNISSLQLIPVSVIASPEPVRKRESDSRCWTWDCGNGGQYRGGDFVLQDNGPEKLEFL